MIPDLSPLRAAALSASLTVETAALDLQRLLDEYNPEQLEDHRFLVGAAVIMGAGPPPLRAEHRQARGLRLLALVAYDLGLYFPHPSPEVRKALDAFRLIVAGGAVNLDKKAGADVGPCLTCLATGELRPDPEALGHDDASKRRLSS